jgi:hypothetical protein
VSLSCIVGKLDCPDSVCLAVVILQTPMSLSPLTDSSKTGARYI